MIANTTVITVQSIITKLNKISNVTIGTSSLHMYSGSRYIAPSVPLASSLYIIFISVIPLYHIKKSFVLFLGQMLYSKSSFIRQYLVFNVHINIYFLSLDLLFKEIVITISLSSSRTASNTSSSVYLLFFFTFSLLYFYFNANCALSALYFLSAAI